MGSRKRLTSRSLGSLEELVMWGVLACEDQEGHMAAVAGSIHERIHRQIQPATVGVTLRRLHERGLVLSRIGDPGRGGKKRLYRLSQRGRKVLRHAYQDHMAMWAGLEDGV